MKPPISRRDFLKLLALTAATFLSKSVDRLLFPGGKSHSDTPGVIILVLDTLSALNMSLHGYARQTTPNMERFASRSNVYHSHYSTANFTSPGTASILTGTHPWTHRAFHNEGLVSAEKTDSNLFRWWGDDSIRLGYTQNAWVDLLLDQFSSWLDVHLNLYKFNLNKEPFYRKLLKNDFSASYRSLDSFSMELDPNFSASLMSALMRKTSFYLGKQAADREHASQYPMGVPQTVNDVASYFLLEDVFDGLMESSKSLPPSALAYFHLYPPHFPYAPRAKFMDVFKDGWLPPVKPTARLVKAGDEEAETRIVLEREHYDAYIATVDEDFGRLFDFMEREGVLEKNYVVLTSDHGDIYERGVIGHTNEYLYEPLIRVPLIISSPGQTSRVDVRTPTSSVDLAPTLLALTGRPIPIACEGVLLPGLGGEEDAQRPIFSMDAKSSHVRGPIRTATLSIRKGQFKLIWYFGYEGLEDGFELFDLENDPEEMSNLTAARPALFSDLRAELDAKLREVNAPFVKE